MNLAARRTNQLAEFVVEAFLAEVVLLFGDPFLQAEMRFNQEFRHLKSSLSAILAHVSQSFQQQLCPSVWSCSRSATRRARIILTWSSIRARAPAASRISIRSTSLVWISRICLASFD